MAQKGIKRAIEEKHLDLTHWAENTVFRLKHNFRTQGIFPYGSPGPYPGSPPSTKDAFNSIYAKVYSAAGGDTEKISFFFNYYLYFVDMGVGAGQKIEEVDRSDKARYNRRYKQWRERGDRQSRPAFAMELRHQLFRLNWMVSAYYGRLITNGVIMSITGEEPKDDGGVLIK